MMNDGKPITNGTVRLKEVKTATRYLTFEPALVLAHCFVDLRLSELRLPKSVGDEALPDRALESTEFRICIDRN